MANAEIYYFTGSGNSLHVAKELQQRLPGSVLIPMVSLMSRDSIETGASTVGFVFPVHGMTTPVPVRKFLERLDVDSATYLFAIATRGGTPHNAFARIDRILGKSGKRLGSSFNINMANNDPKFKDWKPPAEDALIRQESEVRERLDLIGHIVADTVPHRESGDDGALCTAGLPLKCLVLSGMIFMERTRANDYFYADAKCAGCGTCEKVCPSRKIRIAEKRPVWQRDVTCYFCYACVNYCPKKAVQIKSKIYMKSYTESNERYPHPYATVNEMARQKYDAGPRVASVHPKRAHPGPNSRETGPGPS